MPCAENLSLPEVQKDLQFWKTYEEELYDPYFYWFIPFGYACLISSVYPRFNMELVDQRGDNYSILRLGVGICFVWSYSTIPMFLWFTNFRIHLFVIHIFALHGLITSILLCRQKENVVSIPPDSSLGVSCSIQLGIVFMSAQYITVWQTLRHMHYECPEKWFVVFEDWVFRATVCLHSVSYVILKGAWTALNAKTLLITKDDKLVGKMVKEGDEWFTVVEEEDEKKKNKKKNK
ncbi:unnamed protein product [Caenorhabditis brenneri]